MPKSVFVSYDYADRAYLAQIRNWANQNLLGAVTITGETEDHRQGGAGAIRNHISPKLTGAAAVLVLVGDNSHNRPWVDYEVNHALSAHKLVIPARLPGTTGASPVPIRSTREVAFSASAIRRALGT